VLDKIRHSSHCLLEPDFAEGLYKTIISETKRIQATDQRTIGFQGEHGAYSEVAARALYPSGAMIPCREFTDGVDMSEEGLIDCGIVPVENTWAAWWVLSTRFSSIPISRSSPPSTCP
jgi:prephenate dehydratase/chorismate mutase/prephenate dehydratase